MYVLRTYNTHSSTHTYAICMHVRKIYTQPCPLTNILCTVFYHNYYVVHVCVHVICKCIMHASNIHVCVHTHTLPSSYIKAHHTALRDSRDYTAAPRHAKELGDSLSAALNHTVFPTSGFYVYYEHYLTIVPDMAFSIGVSFGRCPQISE